MSRALPKAEQRPLGAYYTPDGVARACVATIAGHHPVPTSVLEPSVGGGAFARACRDAWASPVHGIDIDPSATGFLACQSSTCEDFVAFGSRHRAGAFDWVIGNPPFEHAEEHVRQALWLASTGVGMLLRLAFLESTKRVPLWRDHPPSEVHVLTKRPSFTGGGTDSAAYGFFIWRTDANKASTTVLRWIVPVPARQADEEEDGA